MCVESFSWGVRVMGGWTVGVLISSPENISGTNTFYQL
jgi:hypothetical protein